MERIKKKIESYIEKIPYYEKIKDNLIVIILYLLFAVIYLCIIIFFPISILGLVIIPVIILQPKVERFIDRNLNFNDFKNKIDDKSLINKDKISTFFKLILQNTSNWIEYYELRMNLFIRSNRRKRSILMKILLYLSILILSIMVVSFTYLNLGSYWNVIIQLFNYIFLIPLFSLDIRANKPKISYRYFKKTLKYISKRIYLISQNKKIRESIDDITQIEENLNDLNRRIDAFNKLFKPTSDYLREFEVIGIIGLIVGIFLNSYIMMKIDFYIFSLLLLSSITFLVMFYLYYLILHHKINSGIMKSEINKHIEYYLDILTFF